jgi:hypothetical protein
MVVENTIKEKLVLLKNYMYEELNRLMDKMPDEVTQNKRTSADTYWNSYDKYFPSLNNYKFEKHKKSYRRVAKAAEHRKYKQEF